MSSVSHLELFRLFTKYFVLFTKAAGQLVTSALLRKFSKSLSTRLKLGHFKVPHTLIEGGTTIPSFDHLWGDAQQLSHTLNIREGENQTRQPLSHTLERGGETILQQQHLLSHTLGREAEFQTDVTPSPVKEELNNIQVPDFISRHKDEKRIEPLTADQLKSVSKVLQDEIKWPSQLQKWSSEHYMLADGGANVHVSDNEDLLAYRKDINKSVNGFGPGMNSCSIAEGHLFGSSYGYDLKKREWKQFLLNSGTDDMLVIPDGKRIFSLAKLRLQGHFILESGPNLGFIFMPEMIYFPFKVASNGLMYFPIIPNPAKINNIYPHFYGTGRMRVLNLETTQAEKYSVNANEALGSKNERSASDKAKLSAMTLRQKSIKKSAFNMRSLKTKMRRMQTVLGHSNNSSRKPQSLPKCTQSRISGSSKRQKNKEAVVKKAIKLRRSKDSFQGMHRKCGHVHMRRIIEFKRAGRVRAKHLPAKFLRDHKRKNCPICMIAKRKRNPSPKSLNEDKTVLSPWEHVFVDTSGKYRTRSKQGNHYYTVFVDSKTGEKIVIPHKKKKHFPIVFLTFVSRIGVYPKKFFSDKAGEIEGTEFGKLLIARGVELITVPKGEHSSNGLAEKAIQDIDSTVRALLLDSGLPKYCWDILAQHAAFLNQMTSPSLLDSSMTIFESVTGVVPDLDMIPIVGCLAVRLEEKSYRKDLKLDMKNQPGVFVGFGFIQNTYGSVILTDKSMIVSRYQVVYDEQTFPYHSKRKSSSRDTYLDFVLGRGNQSKEVSPEVADDLTDAQREDPNDPPHDPIEIADSSDDDEVQSYLRDMSQEQLRTPAFNTLNPARKKISLEQPIQDEDLDKSDESESLSTRPARKRSKKVPWDPDDSPKQQTKQQKPKQSTSASRIPITEQNLRVDKSLLIGQHLKLHFPGWGGSKGEVMKYDPDYGTYEVHFPDPNCTNGIWIEHIEFDDILKLLPKSWARQQAQQNHAAMVYYLDRACMEADNIAVNNVISQDFTEPKTYEEATKAPDWLQYWKPAFEKEYHQLSKVKKCWKVVDIDSIPEGKSLIGCKWVCVVKYANGKYVKHRARLVALGYQQKEGVDYFESFSPTASQVTVRFIMALTAMPGWYSADLDATCAFISATLPEEEQIYMKPVPGFPLPEGKCLKLIKSAYGLVQAPRQYFLLCQEVYKKCKLTQLKSDQCVFIRHVQNVKGEPPLTSESILESGQFQSTQRIPKHKRVYKSCEFSVAILIVFMYVDNNGCRYNCKELVDEFLQDLKDDGRIDMNWEGNMENFLAVRYLQDPVTGEITADQEAYMDGLLAKYGLTDCNPTDVPLKPKDIEDIERIELPSTPNPRHVSAFSMMVGELLYVAINTCPAIMHHVHFLARFMTKATDKHLEYPKKILRYLKGQKGRKIKWGVNNVKHPFLPGQVHAFADSSWADVLPRRKSTYAYHLLVNNAVFAWKSALSPILALSSAEAELIALASCAQEIAYVRKLSSELGFQQPGPTPLQTDSKGAKQLAENGHFKGRSKHYELRWYFLCDYIDRGVIAIIWRPRKFNLSDLGTSARPKIAFLEFLPIMLGEK